MKRYEERFAWWARMEVNVVVVKEQVKQVAVADGVVVEITVSHTFDQKMFGKFVAAKAVIVERTYRQVECCCRLHQFVILGGENWSHRQKDDWYA